MNIFLGYIVFVISFMTVGCIVLYALEKLIVFLYEQLKEFFFPTPQIPEEVYEQICKDASDFVCKRLKLKPRMCLMPENPEYPPIFINSGQELEIVGTVTAAINKF